MAGSSSAGDTASEHDDDSIHLDEPSRTEETPGDGNEGPSAPSDDSPRRGHETEDPPAAPQRMLSSWNYSLTTDDIFRMKMLRPREQGTSLCNCDRSSS